jgi:uncharacterized membrane protein
MDPIMKFVHLLGVVVAIGGMHYVMTVLLPVTRKLGPPVGPQVMESASKKFHVLVWVSIALLLLSGLHLTFAKGWLKTDRATLLLMKIGLALVVFGISLALSLPIPALAKIQAKRATFIRVNLLLAIVVIFLGVWVSR